MVRNNSRYPMKNMVNRIYLFILGYLAFTIIVPSRFVSIFAIKKIISIINLVSIYVNIVIIF
jgi:hypothetical protein